MRVLLAVDVLESETARARLREATFWARRLNATLDLLFVGPDYFLGFDQHSDPHPLDAEADKLHEGQRRRARQLLELVEEPFRGEVLFMVSKDVVDTIVKASERYNLLMLGTHQRTGMPRFFLGSVAELVVRKSSVPTLILKARD